MTTRKTTTRTTRKTTATKAQEPVTEEILDEDVETTEAQTKETKAETQETKPKTTPVRKKKLEIDHNDLIPVHSAVNGGLIYVSKRSQDRYEFNELGAEDYISMGELITMKSTQPRFLNDGWLIIDDEEAVEFLGLTKLYETIFEIGDLDKFFSKSVEQMENLLDKMPKGFKGTLSTKARELVESGELDSNRKIRLLEDKLDIDLKIFEK